MLFVVDSYYLVIDLLQVSMAVGWYLIAVLTAIVTFVTGAVSNQYGLTPTQPGKSCRDIYKLNPYCRGKSGFYVVVIGSTPNFVYCDMELECGGEMGWMRIADVDVAKGDKCPNGWRKISSPVAACRAPGDHAGCYSAQFTTHQIPYSRVCGMVVGYQKGTPDGIGGSNEYPLRSINGPYVDGVSITYGTPRKHIWTYGIGYTDNANHGSNPVNCPCSHYPGRLPPAFVHENYYCESGASTSASVNRYYTSDPVWDGEGCPSDSSCCSEPNLPWFYRQIPLTSDKHLEARICRDEHYSNEGILVKEIKLFVQ